MTISTPTVVSLASSTGTVWVADELSKRPLRGTTILIW